MKVLITGANGFVGKNLYQHLTERTDIEIIRFTRQDSPNLLPTLLADVDFVFHLAGVNRPETPEEFFSGNQGLTEILATNIGNIEKNTGRKIPVIYTSSTQAENNNAYGISKKAAEDTLFELQRLHNVPVYVFRLPNVFGKWCKPNYNSAVATFCHNIAQDLPIQINDPNACINLIYVDDVVEQFIKIMDGQNISIQSAFPAVTPIYSTTVGELAKTIKGFKDSRNSLMTDRVGTGLIRALYSTYVSYLPLDNFAYSVSQHSDPRGVFVEMLKTPDCGQFSYFTAHPGITRGGHYHHSKTEKFLVIKGQARFKFRHIYTGETHELLTNGDKAEIVETVPGWTHDITNIGQDEMIVMLWANETFDRARPDTFTSPL